jgi:PTS system mannose-specific IIC component
MEPYGWVALLGGVLALDGTSAGQLMLSRPLVAATLAGWVCGSPAAGAMLGLILEALHLHVLPVGAARTPESAPAAVAAGAVYASAPASHPVLLSAVLFALAWEWVGGESVHRLRQINARMGVLRNDERDAVRGTLWHHLLPLALDLLRGVLITGFGLWLLTEVVPPLPIFGEETRVPLLVAAVLAACFAGTVPAFGRSRWRWVAAGGVLGGLVLFLR